MSIAICEDETYMLEELKAQAGRFLLHSGHAGVVRCFTSGEQLVWSRERFDIVLMDIKLAGMSGMDAVQALRGHGKDSAVVFVTSCADEVYRAFDVDAVHYLLKPVEDDRLFHALDKAVERSGFRDSRGIAVPAGGTVQRVALRHILYCEAMDHKLYLNTAEGVVEYSGRLDTLESQLDDRFYRCHRSYVVNMHHVHARESGFAVLNGGDRVPISRRRLREFTARMLENIRSEVL